MKIGICANLQKSPDIIHLAAELGYDYVELPLSQLMELDEAGYADAKQRLADEQIGCECTNVFFPAGIRLTGGGVDEAIISEYVGGALARAHGIGAGIVVFGSGGARKIPDGFPYDEAFGQLARAMTIISDAAAKFGTIIAIEPLNRGETNIINSLGDAEKLMKATDRANIKVLFDYYHFMLESDSLQTLERLLCEGRIVHSHFAEPSRRAYPAAIKPEYTAAFDLLRAECCSARCARCSVEAVLSNPSQPRAEMEAALNTLRKMAKQGLRLQQQ